MKQQKTRLTYSDTNGIIEEGPAPEALIVCIIQVEPTPSLPRPLDFRSRFIPE
jgi:hypothetical protein